MDTKMKENLANFENILVFLMIVDLSFRNTGAYLL
jgi:hypothetical protein